MRFVARRDAVLVAVAALVFLPLSILARPPFIQSIHGQDIRDQKTASVTDDVRMLNNLWTLFDAAADKTYQEQAYRDSAAISLLAYVVASGFEDWDKSFTTAQRMAFCYHFLGDTESALSAYRLALSVAIPGVLVKFTTEQDDPGLAKLDAGQRVVRTLMNIGVLCVNARKLDAARIFFARVIHLTELEAPPTEIAKIRVEHLEARAKTGLADIHQDEGNYEQAVKVYQDCRAIFESEYRYLQLRERCPANAPDRASMLAASKLNLAHCQRNLGEAYLDNPHGNIAEAKAQLDESLRLRKEIGNNVLIADSELAIGELAIAEHRYDDGLRLAASAASLTAPDSAGDNPDTYWQALLCQGKSLLELGRLSEATASLETAIQVVEGLKDPDLGVQENKGFFNSITWFFRQKVAPYIAMAEVCIRRDEPMQALRYAELAKARTLLLGRPLDTVNREDSLGAISISPDELSRVLAVAVPDQSTAALEYMFGTDRSYVFLISRSGTDDRLAVKVVDQPIAGPTNGGNAKDLDSDIELFRSSVEKSYKAYPNRVGYSLYEALVQPFERELAEKEHVIVVPTDNLWRIPFEALSTSQTEPAYLVKNFAVSYTPSLIFLARIIERANRGAQPGSSRSLVLADPLMIERLPSSSDSGFGGFVSVFGGLSGLFQNRSFTGIEATRQNFLREASTAQLVVIATHAVAAGNNPVESFFAVTPERGLDPKGKLTARDIMSERLSANLVILCACETEKGRYVEGEGEIGCGWAFLYAGCASTLVSQWRVDRDATLELTKEFCRGLEHGLTVSPGRFSLAALLRSAKLRLLEDGRYRHPFYWAGVVLVGDTLWRSETSPVHQ
jgi:CHAT domain-containing protein